MIVRQYRHRSLAYFSACITPNHYVSAFAESATYLALGNDSRAYGTFTHWNTQIYELYSPFKAHTRAMMQNRVSRLGKCGGHLNHREFAEFATFN